MAQVVSCEKSVFEPMWNVCASWNKIFYKSARKPTAFRRWVLLNEVPGWDSVPRRHVVPLLYEQVAKRIANILDDDIT